MTRREEIEKASICQYQFIGTIGEQEAFKNGFVKGAEWADKTMIEKACKWILNNMHKYIKAKRLGIFVNNTGMVSDFRKAMGK